MQEAEAAKGRLQPVAIARPRRMDGTGTRGSVSADTCTRVGSGLGLGLGLVDG